MVIIRKDNIKIAQSTDYLTGGLCSTYSVIRNLNSDSRYVPYLNLMPHSSPVFTGIVRSSYGTHLLDHLAADAAGLTGGQVAVVALLQVDANLPWCSFSILKHDFLGEKAKISCRILFKIHRCSCV